MKKNSFVSYYSAAAFALFVVIVLLRAIFSDAFDQSSTNQLNKKLTSAKNQVMQDKAADAAKSSKLIFDSLISDLNFTGDILNDLETNQKSFSKINQEIQKQGTTKDKLYYSPEYKRIVNKPNLNVTIGIWGYQVNERKKVERDFIKKIGKTRLLNLIYPSLIKNSYLRDQKIYYYESQETFSYFRGAPYDEMVEFSFDSTYQGFNLVEFWSFLSETMVSTWKESLKQGKIEEVKVTSILPYKDAFGNGPILIFYRPVWNQKSKEFAGGVSTEYSIFKLQEELNKNRTSEKQHIFLIDSDLNILTIDPKAESLLGIKNQRRFIRQKYINRDIYRRSLKDSTIQELNELKLEGSTGKTLLNLQNTALKPTEKFSVSISEMMELPQLNNNGINKKKLYAGVIVPESELIPGVKTISLSIQERSYRNFWIFTLLLALLFIGVFSFLYPSILNKSLSFISEGSAVESTLKQANSLTPEKEYEGEKGTTSRKVEYIDLSAKEIKAIFEIYRGIDSVYKIESANQYSNIFYVDKKESQLLKIQLKSIMMILHHDLVQLNRSTLVKTSKIEKVYKKGKKFFVEVMKESIPLTQIYFDDAKDKLESFLQNT